MFEGIRAHFRRNRHVNAASKAPAVRVADAVPGALVRIEGAIAFDEASLVSPLLRRACVLYETTVQEKRVQQGARGEEWVEWLALFHVAEHVPFWVVDDTGARVRVRHAPAVTGIPVPNVSEAPQVNDDNPTFDRFMRSQGVIPFMYMGIAGDHVFFEGGLAPGERVSVYGRLSQSAMAVAQGYRDVAVSVRELGGTDEEPLVIRRA